MGGSLKSISNNALNDDYLLCYPSYKDMNDKFGLSESTISKYIDILQEIDLIRCDYTGIEQLASGKIKNTKMYYCRAKDDSNLKRSITQRINYLENKLNNNTITEAETITLKELKKVDYRGLYNKHL